jgi:hypothetical protein
MNAEGSRPIPDRSDAGWARLRAHHWPASGPHAVEPGSVGEYAATLREFGEARARADFPEVAAHVAAGCAQCDEDIADCLSMPAQSNASPGLIRRVASLFSGGGLLPVPVRGEDSIQEASYSAEGVAIFVSIQPPTTGLPGVVVRGVVTLDDGATTGIAELLADTETSYRAEIDQYGQFEFSDVDPGTYSLEIFTGGLEIAIERILVAG